MQAYTQQDLIESFAFSFMKPQIEQTHYFRLVTNLGAEIIRAEDVVTQPMPVVAEVLERYVEGMISNPREIVECREGWIARMSASGYCDCTDWCEYPSEGAAIRALIENYAE